ncbi:MAG: hypothetical protein J6W90_04425, partial [Verrucomicrobia bacterium]|nr:hypothetical protein [Verrucomicrobiota bacterium]
SLAQYVRLTGKSLSLILICGTMESFTFYRTTRHIFCVRKEEEFSNPAGQRGGIRHDDKTQQGKVGNIFKKHLTRECLGS